MSHFEVDFFAVGFVETPFFAHFRVVFHGYYLSVFRIVEGNALRTVLYLETGFELTLAVDEFGFAAIEGFSQVFNRGPVFSRNGESGFNGDNTTLIISHFKLSLRIVAAHIQFRSAANLIFSEVGIAAYCRVLFDIFRVTPVSGQKQDKC